MLDDYDFISKYEGSLHVEQDGVTNALLVLNAKTGEGILVNSEGSAYARYSAYLPFAKPYLEYEIARIADYCVTEGAGNTTDGVWAISFDEIYEHYGMEITKTNGLSDMLVEQLKAMDEIEEVEITEDEINLHLHLEYCHQSNSSLRNIDAEFSLLSLLGCTLEDVHFVEKDGSDIVASITELNSNMITEQGRTEWEDVLSSKVCKVFNHQGMLMIELEGCDKLRLQSFAYAAKGLSDQSCEWFKNPEEPKIPWPKDQYEVVDQETFELAYAKHVLWLNDIPGGEQLDLSECWLDCVNMANRKLLNAKITDCVFKNVNMESAELCFANFSGSFFENCSMKYTTADEINMRSTTLKNCDLSYILLMHGNFAHATFYKSDLFNCRISNSCYEGARFVDTSTEDQYIDTDNEMSDEEWTLDTEGQVMQ